MSWVQQQPPPSQTPQSTTSSSLQPGSMRQHVSSSVGLPATTSSTLNSSTKPHNLAHSINNQPTRHHWQQQNSSMMQPTPNPPNNYNATPMNKWPQQQQSSAGNVNMFQPITTKNWMQSDMSATSISQQQPPAPQQQQQDPQQAINYASYFTQSPQVDNNYMQQQYQKVPAFSNYQQHQQSTHQSNTQQQPPQAASQQPIQPPLHQATVAHQTSAAYQSPATHPTLFNQQQQEPQTQNYIDNNNSKIDGWSDWDWNDNSNINNTSSVAEQQTHAQLEQQSLPAQVELQQQTQYNVNFIEDSFRTENNNDDWQWGSSENNTKAVEQKQQLPTVAASATAAVEALSLLTPAATAPPPSTQFHQPQVPIAVTQSLTPHQHFAEFSVATAKPASLPLTAAATAEFNLSANTNSLPPRTEVISDNLNNVYAVAAPAASTTTTSNIPNSVYVSQAKPVAKPSRQYASPPVASPTELPELSALSPPHAFQNECNLEAAIAPTPILSQFVASSAATAAATPLAVQPPTAMTPPAPLAPPIGNSNVAVGNPFKRAGAAQHHRGAFIPSHTNNTQPLTPISAMNFVVPPPPADFATPMQPIVAENMEPDNSEILHENQEVIVPAAVEALTLTLPSPAQVTATHPPPNDERNQYLQTSHLSENPDEELNIETDNFPPPGLSRLVLGQPEFEASQRMVTGTDQGVGNMNIDERHADGEDTSVEQLLPTLAINAAATASSSANIIDITTDRNLYLVAGESITRNEQRVVTGVERISNSAPGSQIINEQREIELDGENLEDQQLQQVPPPNTVTSRNEPPLEGAVANSVVTVTLAAAITSNTVESSHKQANTKDHSNISTGNDESDPLHEHQRYASKSSRNRHETNALNKKLEKQRNEKQRSVDRYASEDTEDEYPSEHERDRRRNYREGSTRSDRGLERDLKEKKNRRDIRGDFGATEREREREKHHHHYRAEGGERSEGGSKSERRSQRYHRYEADSKYETEESTRHEATSRKERRSGRNERERDRVVEERSGRSDRSDRDYGDYRRYHHTSKREGKRVDVEEHRDRRDVYAEDERRRRAIGARRGEKDYHPEFDNTIERRNNRRSDKQRGGGADPLEYEEYRKQSSRNARESDLDKDRRNARGFDSRHAGMYGTYPSTAYGYDPYTYYYEQMARTNPQAYAEWYKKYYGQAVALHGNDHLHTGSTAANTDGRESVHSGRSSANNENDRFTHAYISQANEYHRHFMHHQQQQQLANNLSHTMNSTMLEEAAIAGSQSNQNYSLYSLSGGHSTGNLSQIHATTTAAAASYYAGCGGGTAANMDYAYYARSEYAESRSGNLSLRETAEPQRLTPCKFVNDHAVVSFSAGLLITVKPKYTPNGVSNIVKLLRLGANDSSRQLFQAFPGPLVRGLTHKKTIIEFCEEQIHLGPTSTTIYAKQLLPSNGDKFKASYTLMWNLLILLLRQNGMVVGTDIAELLLKNQVQFPYVPQSNTPNSTASNSIKTRSKSDSDSNEDVDLKDSDIECDVTEPGALKSAVTSTEESAHNGEDSVASLSKSNTAASSCSSEEEITAKFRNFLLYGNVNEALDWATDNNLWGHALFLASKVDRRSHANVMMKFANKLSLNDPLQTLYQLMSGRTPSSVTSVQDEKWGDWRPHLSMILSNTSQKPELDRKAITTLGDSLFNRGDLYAAHFCYLMAQVGFGRYHESAVQETTLQQSLPKLVLLGSSHYKLFKEFANNEAVIMTEIYEYACSLNDDKFSLVEFQPYKYLLAARMLDYGYQLKSLMYMEQISMHIERDPGKYEPSFINKVYEFADRLKFYDPVLEKTIDDPQNTEGSLNSAAPNFEEQKWLQILRGIAAQNKPDYGFVASGNTVNLNAADENTQLDYQKQFAEINKQFNELNMQYNSINNSATEGNSYNTDNVQQQMHSNNDNNNDVYAQQQQQQQAVIANNANYVGVQYAQSTQQAYTNETQAQTQDIVADNYAANYGQQYVPTQQQQQSQYYDPNQQQQQQTEFNASNDAQNSGSYDYWGGQQQQQQQQLPGNEQTSRPTISMPNAKKSYDSDGADDQKQQQQAGNNSIPKKNKNDGKDGKGLQPTSNQNSGWFGGIWNKLSLKPKNQMILPDDKNPTIVWDAEKKRWVNTDGAEDAGADILKPPPKMGELMSQQQQPQQIPFQQQQQMQNLSTTPAPTQLPQYEHNQYGNVNQSVNQLQQQSQQLSGTTASLSNAVVNPIQTYSAIGAATAPATTATTAESTKPPSLQSNMFKMQRNRTLKNSYVDVFNPSGAPMSKAAENVLAPALPPATVPQGGFFIPGAPNVSNDVGTYQQEPAQDLPQFYNPNQYGAATGSSY